METEFDGFYNSYLINKEAVSCFYLMVYETEAVPLQVWRNSVYFEFDGFKLKGC